MVQATYATTPDARFRVRGVVKFGNNTIPVIGGTLGWIDLNDGVSWFAQDVLVQRDNHYLQLVQNVWRAQASWIAEDFTYAKIQVPILYDDQGGSSFTAALAPLLNSGEQYLTFDNSTAVLVKCKSVGAAKRTVTAFPYLYDTTLEFWAREPFFKDLTQSSDLAVAVAGSSGSGTVTNRTQSYTGTFWAEPQFVLHVPSGNTVSISSMTIANTTSNETLTITFAPVLAANLAHTVTVDSGLFKVTTETGLEQDVAGTFPMLYNNPTGAAQNNVFAVTIVASGATTGLTFDWTWNSRWAM